MSFLDTLPEAQQDEYRAAVMAVAQDYRTFCDDRDRLAAEAGPRAVAEAAYYDGHPLGTVEAIQRDYEARRDKARRADAA